MCTAARKNGSDFAYTTRIYRTVATYTYTLVTTYHVPPTPHPTPLTAHRTGYQGPRRAARARLFAPPIAPPAHSSLRHTPTGGVAVGHLSSSETTPAGWTDGRCSYAGRQGARRVSTRDVLRQPQLVVREHVARPGWWNGARRSHRPWKEAGQPSSAESHREPREPGRQGRFREPCHSKIGHFQPAAQPAGSAWQLRSSASWRAHTPRSSRACEATRGERAGVRRDAWGCRG